MSVGVLVASSLRVCVGVGGGFVGADVSCPTLLDVCVGVGGGVLHRSDMSYSLGGHPDKLSQISYTGMSVYGGVSLLDEAESLSDDI